jgi:hypothetical protein
MFPCFTLEFLPKAIWLFSLFIFNLIILYCKFVPRLLRYGLLIHQTFQSPLSIAHVDLRSTTKQN